MEQPLSPRERDGLWVGLGASQGKGGLASICAAVARLREEDIDPAGRISVAVCSEGSSSHASSEVLYRNFQHLPAGAVLVVGTGNHISLGNRGRVDVAVRVEGRATHSSAAGPGDNPIPIVAEVLRRLEAVPAENASHPQLGSSSLVSYRLQCGPVAPHTIPGLVRARARPPDPAGRDADSSCGRDRGRTRWSAGNGHARGDDAARHSSSRTQPL